MSNVVFTFNFGIEYDNNLPKLYYLDKEVHYENDSDYLEHENMKLGQIKKVNIFAGRYKVRANTFDQAYEFIKKCLNDLNNDITYQQNMRVQTLHEQNNGFI